MVGSISYRMVKLPGGLSQQIFTMGPDVILNTETHKKSVNEEPFWLPLS